MAIIKRYIDWYNVQKYIESVYYAFKDDDVTGVYGIPRGGLILAVLVSHKMNIPLLQAPIENCIIIDDICDSGETLVHYAKNTSGREVPKYHITTMHYKKNDLMEPELWYDYKNTENEWIVYPWEVNK